MADYNSYKIEIFTGINDVAVNPSPTSGGNISHLYDIYNQLIDAITSDITHLQDQVSIVQAQLPTSQLIIDKYDLINVNTTYNRGLYEADLGTVPQTGRLIKATMNEVNDPYRILFNIGGVIRYFSDYQKFPDGHEWIYPNAPEQDVTEGDPLKLRSRGEELNRTVSIYIAS